jgi:predicted oxidoreductase
MFKMKNHMDNYRVALPSIIVGTMRLGGWGAGFDEAQYEAFIEDCLGMGAYAFDHADIYGDYSTEAEFGAVLGRKPHLRQQMTLISKCGIRRVCHARPGHRIKSYDCSKAHIIESVENSLRALRTDYLDILLLHRPDLLLAPDEVAAAVAQLNEQGKIKDFGVSNFPPHQFDLLNDRVALCTNQVEASVLKLDAFVDGTISQCQRQRIPVMAWSPLGGGAIFGAGDERVARIKSLAAPIGQRLGLSLDQTLLAWLMRHPAGILPVVGTSKIERVKVAMQAVGMTMSREDWYGIWQASTGETIA